MCKHFSCYPNLWALYEWANWLTPASFPTAYRFNAAFFLTCLTKIPPLKLDFNEIEEKKWTTPAHAKKTLLNFLPPPQQYEVTVMANYLNLESLLEYALKKSQTGVELYFPVSNKFD